MKSLLLLSDVERRRLTRWTLSASRQNPLLVPLLLSIAVAGIWLAAKAGEGAAVLAVFLPFGLRSITVMVLLGGLLLGVGLTAAAPRFENLDPQIRTAPVTATSAYMGTTGVPLLVAWALLAIPVFSFGLALFSNVRSPSPLVWAALLILAQLIACATGATLLELGRARLTPAVAIRALPVLIVLGAPMAAAPLMGAPAWAWLAAFLPGGLGHPIHGVIPAVHAPSVATALLGFLVLGSLAAGAWTALGPLPGRRPAGGEQNRSLPIPRALPLAMGAWLISTAVRDRRIRIVMILGLVSSIGMILATTWLAGRSAPALTPLAAILLLQAAAGAPLALSHELARGRWLWGSIPASRTRVGGSWWLATGLMTAALGLIIVSPTFAIMPVQGYPFLLGALLLSAPIPAAVGRLIPFRHDSLARQLGVLGTQLLFFLGALGLIVMVSQKLPTLAAPVAILAALLLATALISIRAPWREA
jgi:hypothetical protein